MTTFCCCKFGTITALVAHVADRHTVRRVTARCCQACFLFAISIFCAAVSRFFTFQVFATFIYQFVVGAALGRIQEIIKDPTGQIVEILGVSAAQTSSFFMSYIMLNVST